ncbi:AAEL005360-PA [Aedes aegypti]|uniref:AAEL005360-PA n=1 Tax=Aedes aegypti TaxID=7159 RepID=Q17AB2_AEDAE|nr:AAEL005360-PA [Aedes aegypti]
MQTVRKEVPLRMFFVVRCHPLMEPHPGKTQPSASPLIDSYDRAGDRALQRDWYPSMNMCPPNNKIDRSPYTFNQKQHPNPTRQQLHQLQPV